MGPDKIKESSSLLPLDTDLNSILDWYRTSIFEDFSFPCSKWDETLERNSYEIEMFSRLAYDYEQLEKVDQKELKVVIEELLRGGRRKQAHIQKTRKIFLEDREELLPYAFEYQNNTYTVLSSKKNFFTSLLWQIFRCLRWRILFLRWRNLRLW